MAGAPLVSSRYRNAIASSSTPERRHHYGDGMRKRHTDLRKKLAEAKHLKDTALPSDWREKPADYVYIGKVLLEAGHYMTGEELADCLDNLKTLPCRYSQDGRWGASSPDPVRLRTVFPKSESGLAYLVKRSPGASP